jgi:chemotaxis protein MotB
MKMDDEDFNITPEDESGGNEWLATYGDLVTLLLCFFVLLFAMSTVDAKKFESMAISLAASFSGGNSIVISSGGDSILDLNVSPDINTNAESNAKDEMDELYSEVNRLLESEGLSKQISVEKSERGVLLTFQDNLLFDNGKAILKPEVKSILSSLGVILKNHDKKIRIEGHTDNVPIKNAAFPSNWELSTARAISVVNYYTQELPDDKKILPNKFEVAGLAEFNPVAPNDSEENKQKNRRIEIIVFK